MEPDTFETMTHEHYEFAPQQREPGLGERTYLLNDERQPVDVLSAPLIPGSDSVLATAMIPATEFIVTGRTDRRNGRLAQLGFGRFPALQDLPPALNASFALGVRTITEFYQRNEQAPPLDYLYIASCDPSVELFNYLSEQTRFANTKIKLVRAACSGYTLAQADAWNEVRFQGRPLNIGILCAEAMTPLTLGDPTVNIIFGDSAVFVVMPQLGERSRVIGSSSIYQPEDPQLPNLAMPDYDQDLRVTNETNRIARLAPVNQKYPSCITMPGGPALYEQVVESMPQVIVDSLYQAGFMFPYNYPDLLVFHNANNKMQDELLAATIETAYGSQATEARVWERFKLLRRRLIIEMARTSNLSGASIPIALLLSQSDPLYALQMQEVAQKIKRGERVSVLQAAFGAGFFGQATVLEV